MTTCAPQAHEPDEGTGGHTVAYGPSHPWYYLLGSPALPARTILQNVVASGHEGYRRNDILSADQLPEPRRSVALRDLRQWARGELRRNLRRYRVIVLRLHAGWQPSMANACPAACDDLHVAASLKHNHLYNDLAHLALTNRLLARQPDLFGA